MLRLRLKTSLLLGCCLLCCLLGFRLLCRCLLCCCHVVSTSYRKGLYLLLIYRLINILVVIPILGIELG